MENMKKYVLFFRFDERFVFELIIHGCENDDLGIMTFFLDFFQILQLTINLLFSIFAASFT